MTNPDTTQQMAQDIARQQNAEAGAPWADQEEYQRAKAEAEGGAPSAATQGSYADSTVNDLKEELADRDLPRSGKKEELVARLEADDEQKQEGAGDQAS